MFNGSAKKNNFDNYHKIVRVPSNKRRVVAADSDDVVIYFQLVVNTGSDC